ncbi:MAG TPA: amino acid ABC transporter permease [Bdellovibrionota bacterium]|jgi:polar amino acid transport system permease protein|nr:amino acid ABC transporter permease [Bdellovibrionota bacterium]
MSRNLVAAKLSKACVFLLGTAVGFTLLSLGVGELLSILPEPIGSRADLFIEGARTSLYITLYSAIIGLIVGVVMGLSSGSSNRFVRGFAWIYVWLIRGTPVLVQILFVYYAVPALFPSLQLNEFWAAVFALGLNVGAYNGEVIRAGIEAVPKGQTEAARSLGLSKAKTMRWVVLPQAIRIVVPPLVNNIVALLKDSSLASAIGLLELTLAGNRISSETFLPVPVLSTVALLYLIYTSAITVVTHYLKKIMRWA